MPVAASTASSCCCRASCLRRRFALPHWRRCDRVRVEDVAGRRQQARPLLDGERDQQAAVAHDRLECLGRVLQPLGELVRRGRAVGLNARHRRRVAGRIGPGLARLVLRTDHPELLLELADDADQHVLRCEVDRPDAVEPAPDPLGDLGETPGQAAHDLAVGVKAASTGSRPDVPLTAAAWPSTA